MSKNYFTPPHYYYLVILTLIILFLSSNVAFSNGLGWRKMAPPCDTIPNSPWSQAFTKKICADQMSFNPCPDSCCYTIVYQYRWLPNDLFELNISGIFMEGPGNCDTCINSVFSHAYMSILVDISTKDPNFKSRAMSFNNYDWGDPRPTYDAWVKISTTAKCFNNGMLCDNGIRCCWYKSNITFDRNPNNQIPDYVVSAWYCPWITNINYPCPINPPSCLPDCWKSAVRHLDTLVGSKFCDVPCNTGMWDYRYEESIPITGCNGCYLAIFYRYRETVNCTPTFKDIELLFADVYGNCQFCLTSTSNIIKLAWRWLLLNAEVPDPAPNSCDTTYRAITAPCWKDDSITVVPPESLHFQSCIDSACCWAVYEKCNYGDTLITFNKFQTGTTYEPWFCYQYDSCNVACNWFPSYDSAFISHPRKIDYDIENMILQTKTLPCRNILTTDNNIDIFLQNDIKGEIKLELYNAVGIRVFIKIINKNEFFLKQKVELDTVNNGLYFYKLMKDNEILCSGKLLIVRE